MVDRRRFLIGLGAGVASLRLPAFASPAPSLMQDHRYRRNWLQPCRCVTGEQYSGSSGRAAELCLRRPWLAHVVLCRRYQRCRSCVDTDQDVDARTVPCWRTSQRRTRSLFAPSGHLDGTAQRFRHGRSCRRTWRWNGQRPFADHGPVSACRRGGDGCRRGNALLTISRVVCNRSFPGQTLRRAAQVPLSPLTA